MTKGRALFLALLVALIYWAPVWMPVGAQEDQAATRAAEIASAEKADRMIREAERQRESLTPEQRALLDDLKGVRGDISKSAVRQKLLTSLDKETKTLTFYEWAAQAWRSGEIAYHKMQPHAESWLWTFTIIVVATGLAAAVASRTRIARFSARLGFGVARAWLVILSFLAIAIAMATRTNPWPSVPHELVFAPIAALVGCAIALRLVDLNYPVWNSLVRGFGAPLISMGFVAVFLKLA